MGHRPGQLLVALAIASSAAFASACAQERDDEPTAVDTTDVCALFEDVRDLDDEVQGLLNDGMGPVLAARDADEAEAAFSDMFDDVVPVMEERLPTLKATYDGLAEAVPTEMRSDVEMLRDFSVTYVEGIAGASGPGDMLAAADADPDEVRAVAQATLRLDEYSRETCDVVIAD